MSDDKKLKNNTHSISVLIPSYNEEIVIEDNIKRVITAFQKLDLKGEILVCDDGSSDKTKEIITHIAKENPLVKSFSYSNNRGYGYAFKYLLNNASCDFAIAMDADLSMDPEDTLMVFKDYFDDYDIIVGSRYKGIKAEYPLKRRIPSKIYILLNKILFNLTLQDTQSGFFAIKKEAYKKIPLESDGFSVLVEIFTRANALGYKIIEIPIKYKYETASGEASVIKCSINMFFETLKIKKNFNKFLKNYKKQSKV
jgi:glycosyltransferase involved in cell wall biosynthesis